MYNPASKKAEEFINHEEILAPIGRFNDWILR